MGPFSAAQITDKIKSRELSALDFCWREGFREWRPLSSVDEFERRGKIKSLSPYPSVALPNSNGTTAGKPQGSGDPIKQNSETPKKDQKTFKIFRNELPTETRSEVPRKFIVSFSRAKKSPLSIYEWTLALGLTLGFAYAAVHFALGEVQRTLQARLAFLEAGVPLVLGEFQAQDSEALVEPEGFVPEAWYPLYSAPGYVDWANQNTHSAMARFEVLVEGLPGNIDGQVLEVNGFRVPGANVKSLELTTQGIELDPVLVKRTRVQGYLNPLNPKEILVRYPGSPFLYP